MSYNIFKQNMLTYMRNQPNIAFKEQFAKKITQEYDALVKRGFDSINGISLIKGNTEVMERVMGGVLNTALQQSSGEHAIITNMGKAFRAYWTITTMNSFPPPTPSITPAGIFIHIVQISNFATSPGTWNPSDITLETPPNDLNLDFNVYDKLDWSKIPLDKNSVEVQEIINPNINTINQKIRTDGARTDLEKSVSTQLNTLISEIIDNALIDQGLVPITDTDTNTKSGYSTLDKLLRIAGKLAPKLGKNLRVRYENLKSGYINGVHGLCPQGTQCVVAALTGIEQLGRISGHADWFSFKNPGTDTNGPDKSTFVKPIGGITYYNNKVRVGNDYINNPSQWQVGDVIAMGYTGGKKYGHIQVWTGWAWVSDFTQRQIQKSKVDLTTIALWRLNQNGLDAVKSQRG